MYDLFYKSIEVKQNDLNNLNDDFSTEYYKNLNTQNDSPDNSILLLSTSDKIIQYFDQISQFWKTNDFLNLNQLFQNYNITIFDDSFDRFEIPELASQTFKTSDDTIPLINILSFLLKLIKVDDRYIMCLLKVDFLNSLFRIYTDVKSCQLSIQALKCASEMASKNIDLRNNVYLFAVSRILTSNVLIERFAVYNEIFILIQTFLSFEIDPQMFDTISEFLISKISTIISYITKKKAFDINNENFDDQVNRLACENYSYCLALLSKYPAWTQLFLQKKNDITKLFIDFLYSKDKIILICTYFALGKLCENIPIDIQPLVYAIISNLFKYDNLIISYICDTLISLFRKSDITIFKDLLIPIIDRLFKLIRNCKFSIKNAIFKTIAFFFYMLPQYLPKAIENGLFNIIDSMLEMEDRTITLSALALLSCIFENEARMGSNKSLRSFIEREGMIHLKEILESDEKDEEGITNSIYFFLLKYDDFEEIDIQPNPNIYL